MALAGILGAPPTPGAAPFHPGPAGSRPCTLPWRAAPRRSVPDQPLWSPGLCPAAPSVIPQTPAQWLLFSVPHLAKSVTSPSAATRASASPQLWLVPLPLLGRSRPSLPSPALAPPGLSQKAPPLFSRMRGQGPGSGGHVSGLRAQNSATLVVAVCVRLGGFHGGTKPPAPP